MIRIAIVGGGLAGSTLMLALLQWPHLDVHIFESADEFREAGAAIVLTRNATGAFDLLTPTASQCIKKAGAVSQHSVRFMLAGGPDSGSVIGEFDASGEDVTTIVHRADLLREILADVPPDRMHVGKKLVSINDREDGPITAHFSDGSTHECDILIGADGIHSRVRKHILGENDPAVNPIPAGWWAVMALGAYDEVQAELGDLVNKDNPREYDWVGDGSYMIHHITSEGRLVQYAIAVRCAKDGDDWQKTVTAEEIEFAFRSWPTRLSKAVTKLLGNQPNRQGIYFWEHLPAHTYVSGPICITGDAAHSTTPWQGSGGGMTVEDSLILSTLFGKASSVEEARNALEVYDEVRRPRTQRVVRSSNETGMMLSGCHPEFGLDLAKLKPKLLSQWDFILQFDNRQGRDEAIRLFEAKIQGRGEDK